MSSRGLKVYSAHLYSVRELNLLFFFYTYKSPYPRHMTYPAALITAATYCKHFPLLCDQNQIHQDEDSHEHLHLQPGSCRRLGHQHAALPERQVPHEHLAVWGSPVQAHYCHRLLQHVHKHLHPHHDECGPLHRRVPPSQGAGISNAGQSQDDQRAHLGSVLCDRGSDYDHGCDQSDR